MSVSIYQLLLCKEWIADRRCGVGTIVGECLNLVPIALVCNELLIGDAEWE